MEPDSVIEDKTIELMVSAARWAVCSSGRPAPGGLAHLGVRREAGPGPSPPPRPRPGPSASPGLGPGAAPPAPSRSQAGPGAAPPCSSALPLPCPRARLSHDPRSLMLGPELPLAPHPTLPFSEGDSSLFSSLALCLRPGPAPLRPNEVVGGDPEAIGPGRGLRTSQGSPHPLPSRGPRGCRPRPYGGGI